MRHFSISCSKLFVLICFLSCLTTIVFGQDNDENLPNSPCGSATDLKGKTVVINCFVSKAGLEWTTEEKEKVLAKQNDGLAWLKKQAYNWKAGELSFEEVNLGLEKDITVDHIDHAFDTDKIRKLRTHWATFALHAAGITKISHFYDTLKTAHNADNVVVLVFANESGRSYAQPTIESLVKINKVFSLKGQLFIKQARITKRCLVAQSYMKCSIFLVHGICIIPKHAAMI